MRIRSPLLMAAVIFLPFLSFPGHSLAQTASEGWNLEDRLRYGLANQPSLQQAIGQVNAGMARIGQTKTNLRTKVNAQSSLTKTHVDFQRSAGRVAAPGSTNNETNQESDSVSVRQLVYDSGQVNQRVKSQEFSLQAAKNDLRWQQIQVAAGIKTAYFRVLQAKALVKVQHDSLASFQEHLAKVRGFVEVGSRPPFDITKAEVDVANAQVSLIKAESNYSNTLSALAKAVGFEGKMAILDPASSAKPVQPDLNWDEVWTQATQRPDLLSGFANASASRSLVNVAKKSRSPSLSTSAGYNWNGTDKPLDRSWNLGVSLSVPIFDGKLQKYQVKEAEANLDVAKARIEQTRQGIKADAETVITGILDAFKRLEATEVLMKQASESLHLARGRYDAGVGSPIEITDAQASFSSAEGSWFTAFYDSLIALTLLDQTTGRLPIECPPTLFQDSPAAIGPNHQAFSDSAAPNASATPKP